MHIIIIIIIIICAIYRMDPPFHLSNDVSDGLCREHSAQQCQTIEAAFTFSHS